MYITIFTSEKFPNPRRSGPTSLTDFGTFLKHREVRHEKSGLAFAPIRLQDDKPRKNEYVQVLSAYVADIDAGPPYPEIASILPWHHFAYSTHSHTPWAKKHCYRIVVPYAREVAPDEHASLWRHFHQLLNGQIDQACKDLSRLYYLPSCPPGEPEQHAFSVTKAGTIFDPDTVLKTAVVEKKSNVMDAVIGGERTVPLSEAREILRYIDPNCDRGTWIRILFALGHEYGESARGLVHEWSSGGLMGASE